MSLKVINMSYYREDNGEWRSIYFPNSNLREKWDNYINELMLKGQVPYEEDYRKFIKDNC